MAVISTDIFTENPLLLLAVAVVSSFILAKLARGSSLPLPPGPKGKFYVGNAFDVNGIRPCGERPMFTLWNFGAPTIVINKAKIAHDLFDRRAENYNDRPRFIMGNEIIAKQSFLGFMRSGNEVRSVRRLFSEVLSPSGVKTLCHPVQMKEVGILVRDLLKNPHGHNDAFARFTVSVMMTLVYSKPITSNDDPIVAKIKHSMDRLFQTFLPGAFLVDIFPVLLYVPKWFPGAGWKRMGEQAFKEDAQMFADLYEEVRAKIDHIDPCFVSRMIESDAQKRHNLSYYNMTYVGGSMFGAGVDTTNGGINAFLAAMLLYPHVQEKARAEVDSVIGTDRMPTFDDLDDLPYVRAVMMETNRWKPLTPMGVARRANADDTYDGFFIPKGTTLIPSMVAMAYDEEVYPNANEYKPERWLNPDGTFRKNSDDAYETFGFGRRICPGSNLADASTMIVSATLLWAFNMTPKLDAKGKPTDLPNMDMATFQSSVVATPQPFSATLTPRGPHVARLAEYD